MLDKSCVFISVMNIPKLGPIFGWNCLWMTLFHILEMTKSGLWWLYMCPLVIVVFRFTRPGLKVLIKVRKKIILQYKCLFIVPTMRWYLNIPFFPGYLVPVLIYITPDDACPLEAQADQDVWWPCHSSTSRGNKSFYFCWIDWQVMWNSAIFCSKE